MVKSHLHLGFRCLLFLGFFFQVLFQCGTAQANQVQTVRIMIVEPSEIATLTIRGGYQVRDFFSSEIYSDSSNLPGVNIRIESNALKIAGVKFPKDILIVSDKDSDLIVNGRSYRGHLSIHWRSAESFIGVNHIDLEDYLKGVLFHEVGSWWPMESLKAQAVASRTYAIYQASQRKSKLFDMFDSQSSQVYGGSGSERPRSDEAVDLTRGEVLKYNGEIFPTFFHATCGGMTRDSSELWNIDMTPLRGGVECSTCWFSPHYHWSAKIKKSEMNAILRSNGVEMGEITHIEISELTDTHRVLNVKIDGKTESKIVSAKELRTWIGSSKMRSEDFDIQFNSKFTSFKGKGWGHGVGLCQWGALGMSILRQGYDQILQFYYPESKLETY